MTSQQLLDFKSKLEQNVQSLKEESEKLVERIARKREEVLALQASKLESIQKLNRLKLEQFELKNRATMYQAYTCDVHGVLNELDAKIRNGASVRSFELQVMSLVDKFDGAIEFFRDDSLQMELMKRANSVRERRVEYTVVENEYKEMLRKIEEQKREKERREMAHQQKQREIEEEEKRVRFLESRTLNTRQSVSRDPSPTRIQEIISSNPKMLEEKSQEFKLPEIVHAGSLSQFMRW